MRYSLLSATLALASSALAQTPGFDVISSPTLGQNVAAGSTLQIVWDPAQYPGTVGISLLQGANTTIFNNGPFIAASIKNSLGKFDWAVPTNLTSFAFYEIVINDLLDKKSFQYSQPFHITGLSGSSSSSGSASVSGVSTKSTASSSTKSNESSTKSPKTTSTLSITGETTATPYPSATSGSATSGANGLPSQTANAATGNMLTDSLAMLGGLALALAL